MKRAIATGAALADPGRGTEPGTLLEVSGRVQPLPWPGAGASFFQIAAGNNEKLPLLRMSALEPGEAMAGVHIEARLPLL